MSERPVATASAAEAAQLAARLAEAMEALTGVLDRETELVRAGQLVSAADLEQTKAELARRYVADATRLRTSRGALSSLLPADALKALRARHDAFQARLQSNLTVLATAHAVSEGIVRGLSSELARKARPDTYAASGRTGAARPLPAAPLIVSRCL